MAISRFNLPTDLHVSGNVGVIVTGSVYVTNSVSASQFTGSGVGITDLSASNFTDFAGDVRKQLSVGDGLTYSTGSGQFALDTELSGGATTVNSVDYYNILISSGSSPYPTASLAADIVVNSVTASVFSGSGAGLTNIPPEAIDGLNLSEITTGSFTARVSTDSTKVFEVLSGSTPRLTLDHTGSLTVNKITVDTITAREFYTQLVTSSVIYESGSTKFGDDEADLHQITGSLYVSGSLVTINSLNQGSTNNTSELGDLRILKNIEIDGAIVNNPNLIDGSTKAITLLASSQVTASFYDEKYVTSKLVLTAEVDGGGDCQASEALIIRNSSGTSVKLTPYAVTYTSAQPMVSYDAIKDGTNIAIIATNNTSNDLILTTQSIYMIQAAV